jgi:hypothetical protein
MVVVFAISVGPQAVLLVVVGVAGDSLVGVDLLDMIYGRFVVAFRDI